MVEIKILKCRLDTIEKKIRKLKVRKMSHKVIEIVDKGLRLRDYK